MLSQCGQCYQSVERCPLNLGSVKGQRMHYCCWFSMATVRTIRLTKNFITLLLRPVTVYREACSIKHGQPGLLPELPLELDNDTRFCPTTQQTVYSCSVKCTILINHRMFNTAIKYQEADFPVEKPVSLVRELKEDLTHPVALICILIERNVHTEMPKYCFIINQLQFNGCAIHTSDWFHTHN